MEKLEIHMLPKNISAFDEEGWSNVVPVAPPPTPNQVPFLRRCSSLFSCPQIVLNQKRPLSMGMGVGYKRNSTVYNWHTLLSVRHQLRKLNGAHEES